MKPKLEGIKHESALVWYSRKNQEWLSIAYLDEKDSIGGCSLMIVENDGAYIWSLRHGYEVSNFKVDTLEEAKQAAEDALRKHLESERDRFDKLLRELNGRWKSERFNER